MAERRGQKPTITLNEAVRRQELFVNQIWGTIDWAVEDPGLAKDILGNLRERIADELEVMGKNWELVADLSTNVLKAIYYWERRETFRSMASKIIDDHFNVDIDWKKLGGDNTRKGNSGTQ